MDEPHPLPEGELVAGKYALRKLLGRGGMGSVWEGVHVSLGTHVAVKFIESEYVDSAEARQRFENEARAAARLASKHVVKVHDHGVMADGRPYIVMEYLSGEPLEQRLSRAGTLSLADTSVIVTHVCRALTKAHEAGIVHRDLKPENVFLVRDDEDGTEMAKVVDFGIAKFTDSSGGLSSSTKTGSVLGTPYFMSPEQARGLRSIDYRSDLWSIAVIAYRCLVGELPFQGEAVGDLLVQICTAPVPVASQHVPGLPPAFDAWLARALARDPAQRFQSAAELADSLAQIAGTGRGPMLSMAALDSAAMHSAPTVAAFSDSGRVVPPAEGVTAAPFVTQNRTLPKRAAPVGIIIGVAGALVVFLAVGGVLLARGRSAPVVDEPITAVPGAGAGSSEPAASAVVISPPPTAPAVEPSVAPSASEEPSAKPAPGKPSHVSKGGKPVTKPTSGSTAKPPSTAKPGGTDIGY